MLMDSDPVEPNDRVWDSIDGAGTVQHVYNDNFTVKFGRRVRSATYGGVIDGRKTRTLFWAPNNMFIPRKNPGVYNRQKRAVMQIMDIITDMSGVAAVSEDKTGG